MADLEQLYSALRQADAAGNTEDATKLANYIRQQQQAPQPDELGRYKAEPTATQEAKTSNIFKGIAARAAEMAGSEIEAIARGTTALGERMEGALTPEQKIAMEESRKQSPEFVQNALKTTEGFQQGLFDFSKGLKNWSKDIGYAPDFELGELTSNPLKVIPFIAERIIVSSPDMIAAVGATPAYIIARTNEILNDRLENDNKDWRKSTVADVATATGAAILETYLEKFATKHLFPGAGPAGGTVAKRIGKETAIQSGTEGVEEGIGYLGGTAGTEKGIDPYQLAQQMLEGAIVGGGLGATVQGGKEYVSRSRANDGAGEPGISGDRTEGEALGGTGRLDKEGLDVLSKRLGTLNGRETELNNKLKQVEPFIRDIEAIDPNDSRIAEALSTAKQLNDELKNVQEEKAAIATKLQSAGKEKAYNAPGQLGLDFTEPQKGEVGPHEYRGNIPAEEEQHYVKMMEAGKKPAAWIPKGDVQEKALLAAAEKNGWTHTYTNVPNFGPSLIVGTTEEARIRLAKALNGVAFKGENQETSTELGRALGYTEEDIKEWHKYQSEWDKPLYEYKEEAPSRKIESEQQEFGLTAPEGTIDVSKPLEKLETPDYETSKLMMVDTGAKPTNRLFSFIRSLAPNTQSESEAKAYGAELENIVNEIEEFHRDAQGQERTNRLRWLNNFFDAFSIAPIANQSDTSRLPELIKNRTPQEQEALLSAATQFPKLNTARGLDKFRDMLTEHMMDYTEAKLGRSKGYAVLPFDADTGVDLVPAQDQKALSQLTKDSKDPKERAAYNYFSSYSDYFSPYIMAMRSAAYDLGTSTAVKQGELYKGQNRDTAKLFRDWIAQNLGLNTLARFDATVEDFRKQNDRSSKLDKEAQAIEDRGPIDKKAPILQSLFRAPSGSVSKTLPIRIGKKFSRGLTQFINPKRFDVMHPAIQEKINQNDLQGALKLISSAKYGSMFQQNLAKRLLELKLNTTVMFDAQELYAQKLIDRNTAIERLELTSFLKAAYPEVAKKYFNNLTNIKETFNSISQLREGKLGIDADGLKAYVGQIETMYEQYQAGVAILNASGTYLPYLDTITLNKKRGGNSLDVFLHEVTHAASEWALDPDNYDKLSPAQKKAIDELKKLHANALERIQQRMQQELKLGIQSDFNVSDLKEFVAEAFSNPQFQALLQSFSYEGAKEQFRGLEVPVEYARNSKFMNKLKQAKDNGAITFEFDESAEEAIDRSISEEVAKNRGEGVVYDEKGKATTTGTAAETKTYATAKGISKKLKEKAFTEAYNNAKARGAKVFTWEGVKYFTSFEAKPNKRTIWDDFTKAVIKLIGMNNILGYTLANANAILQAPPALSTEAYSLNAKGKSGSYALDQTFRTAPTNKIASFNAIFAGRPSWGSVKNGMFDFLNNLKESKRKYLLNGLTLRMLQDMVGNKVPQLKQFIEETEKMATMRDSILNDVGNIAKEWTDWQKNNPDKINTLNALMIDSSRLFIDPEFNKSDPKLNDAWNAIGPEGRKIYSKARDFFEARKKAFDKSTLNNIKKHLIGKGLTEAEAVAHPDYLGMQKRQAKHTVTPYFPFRRNGEFWYQINSSGGKLEEFVQFETLKERDTALAERQAELDRQGSNSTVSQGNSIRDAVNKNLQSLEFLETIKKMIGAGQGAGSKQLKENLIASVEDLYLSVLPDQSVRKLFNRKGTPGMNPDMLRAFTATGFRMAYQHARYEHTSKLFKTLESAEARLKGMEPKEAGQLRDYINQFYKNLDKILNPPDTHPYVGKISDISFLWYLSGPASAFVNMLGVPAVSFPVVAARFGIAKTAAKMLVEYPAKFLSAGYVGPDGSLAFPSLGNDLVNLTQVQQDAFKELGPLFNLTLTHDVAGLSSVPSMQYTGAWKKTMGIFTALFHGAEKFNREVVGMSIFDMSYERNIANKMTPKRAFEKAISETKELTYKSMGDYSTENKPLVLQNQYSKVIFQFKQFPLTMTYLLTRSGIEGFSGDYEKGDTKDSLQKELGTLQAARSNAIGNPDVNKNEIDQIKRDIETVQRRINARKDTATDINAERTLDGLPDLAEDKLDEAVTKQLAAFKKEGMDRLMGTLGMTFVFGGATAMFGWSAFSSLMEAIHYMWADDDEEDKPFSFDNWFKNWLNETFGGMFGKAIGDFVGESISRGVVSQVTGLNVADRMSLDGMWFRDQKTQPDAESAFQAYLVSLLGPTAALGTSAFRAVDLLNQGHYERALETASPAFVRNFLKANRFSSEGALSLNGDELIPDFSSGEIIGQALGFSPERLAQKQKANIEMKAAEQEILKKHQDLLNAYFMAFDTRDSDMQKRVMTKIMRFNKANPGSGITAESIRESIKRRYKQRALAKGTGGVNINKKLIGQLGGMNAYGDID
jgi:hypothetical protein